MARLKEIRGQLDDDYAEFVFEEADGRVWRIARSYERGTPTGPGRAVVRFCRPAGSSDPLEEGGAVAERCTDVPVEGGGLVLRHRWFGVGLRVLAGAEVEAVLMEELL